LPLRRRGRGLLHREVQYENFLRIKFPEGLDFQQPSSYDTPKKRVKKKKAEESARKFTAYLDQKGQALDKARTQYLDVFGMKQAQWTIASRRASEIYSDLRSALHGRDPQDLKEVDEWGNQPRQIFCDALEDKAELSSRSRRRLREVPAARPSSPVQRMVRLCERELNQMKPSEYPLSSRSSRAGYVSTTCRDACRLRALGDGSTSSKGK